MTTDNSMFETPDHTKRPGGYFRGFLSRRHLKGQRGVTLVEAMVATAVFTMGILGVYGMLIYSYNLETLARHRDNARAVLLSFADKFERLQTTDPATSALRNFFDATPTTPNGTGLSWTDNNGTVTAGTTAGITVTLGSSASSQVQAVVTELVDNLDPNTGAIQAHGPGTNAAAGRIIQATFTIKYTIKGITQSQSLAVTRAVP